jgi:hypothetical protein
VAVVFAVGVADGVDVRVEVGVGVGVEVGVRVGVGVWVDVGVEVGVCVGVGVGVGAGVCGGEGVGGGAVSASQKKVFEFIPAQMFEVLTTDCNIFVAWNELSTEPIACSPELHIVKYIYVL